MPVGVNPAAAIYSGGPSELLGNQSQRKELPIVNVPPDKRVPNYGKGRMYGTMIDHMQKEYKRLGIKPNDHFILHNDQGDPIEYRRLSPDESKDTDWDFMKVQPIDPKAPVA